MAFDGNGNWISDFSAVADRDANIKILASRFDNIFIADIATSFENCLTKDGQVKTQTNFNANNYRVINVANPSDGKDAVNKQTLEGGNIATTGNWTFSGDVALSGDTTAVTPASATDNTTAVATTEWVNNHLADSSIKKGLVSNAMPNYSAGVSVSNTGSYTAQSNGYIFTKVSGGGSDTFMYINGIVVGFGQLTNTNVGNFVSIPMKSGDTLTWDSGRVGNMSFVPCLGG